MAQADRHDTTHEIATDENGNPLSGPQTVRAKHGRNIAIALGLIGFALLMYAVTIVKLGPGVLDRPY